MVQVPEVKAEAVSKDDTGPAGPSGEEEEDDEVGPMPPSANGKRKATAEEEEEDEFGFESDGDEEVDKMPVSHEIVLKDHSKVVSAVAVDPSGARIATGSHDYDTKIWDFGGMDSRLKPFKSFEANGNYHVSTADVFEIIH
jgi:WD40 repeat protein